ncbi:bifunctional nuclease family protein [Picosynechococcus sp. PCC 11901]|uniref:bifunctional nuclease family protein n=1 Tax=Picosynechococcus sp. PCC 11901 TaxID=2579791 RepID=UPI0010FC240A|nr:bifunctional nuclease family protein [Picosynechococcus sp. PCC 11901]QCS50733.1 bifunctional nuclease family protein [Picosynechococcus sp. PCC 11901]
MIEMHVAGIALDAITRSPIILLKDTSERRALPIYIAQDQARSIMNVLEQKTPPRPLTHDLFADLLEAWDLTLDKIIIHALEEHTFYAVLCTSQGEETQEIDCRPSDAIAIALRTESPIWVVEEVISEASIPVDRDADEEERQAFRAFVDQISPEDLIRHSQSANPEES